MCELDAQADGGKQDDPCEDDPHIPPGPARTQQNQQDAEYGCGDRQQGEEDGITGGQGQQEKIERGDRGREHEQQDGRRLQDGGWFSTGIVHRRAPIHRFLGTTPYYQKNGRAASLETRVKNQERSHIEENRLIGGNPQSPRNSDRFGEETMNQDMIPLNRVPEGRVARVIDLFTTGNMRRRLQDIGLIEGTDVECLQKSPAGDPVAYYIRGAVIALRSEDSQNILVRCN